MQNLRKYATAIATVLVILLAATILVPAWLPGDVSETDAGITDTEAGAGTRTDTDAGPDTDPDGGAGSGTDTDSDPDGGAGSVVTSPAQG